MLLGEEVDASVVMGGATREPQNDKRPAAGCMRAVRSKDEQTCAISEPVKLLEEAL